MSRMLQAHGGYEFVEKSFDDEAFSQEQLVHHGYEMVFHVLANARDQMQALLP